MKRLVPATILLAGFAGTLAVSAGPTAGLVPLGETTEPQQPVQPVGLAGCASSNCHGRSGGDDSAQYAWQTSCSVWAEKDPHARAYDVLTGELAKKMEAKLDRNKDGYKVVEDARCLACHANPTLAETKDPNFVSIRAEGVSCEACHGNAAVWRTTHTAKKREAWPGFVDLTDLGTRAGTCAGCHVGGPGRDMNHDMIAAGHPKLNFEFASHLARLPKHWDGKKYAPNELLKAWVVGAFAAGEAACELSGDRQTRKSPWPELAEWNCYACHHELMRKDWRPAADFVKQKTAVWTLPWPLGDAPAADALRDGLGKRLGELTEKVSTSSGKTRLDAVRELQEELRKEGNTAPVDVWERMFRAVEATKTIPDWDTGYRMYLTLGVLETVRRNGKPGNDPKISDAFKQVERCLNLPEHPKESTFDPVATRKAIEALTTELRKTWVR